MIQYKITGENPQLTGEERFIWPAIRRDIDEGTAAQEMISQQRRENGKMGGRPKKANGFLENQKKQMVFLESKKSYGQGQGQGQGKGQGKGQGNNKRFCTELLDSSAPEKEPEILLPLNDGTEFPILKEQCQEWAGLYPAVDVIQQLRHMRAWLDANPQKRKTSRGILRFVTGWLAREQDKGGNASRKAVSHVTQLPKTYDVDQLEATSVFDLPEDL